MPAELVRTIGFVGVGLMGSPMARHLVSAGFQVRVWNRTPGKLASLIGAGAVAAATPAEAVDGAWRRACSRRCWVSSSSCSRT